MREHSIKLSLRSWIFWTKVTVITSQYDENTHQCDDEIIILKLCFFRILPSSTDILILVMQVGSRALCSNFDVIHQNDTLLSDWANVFIHIWIAFVHRRQSYNIPGVFQTLYSITSACSLAQIKKLLDVNGREASWWLWDKSLSYVQFLEATKIKTGLRMLAFSYVIAGAQCSKKWSVV